MIDNKMLIIGDCYSQTGIAVLKRYQNVKPEDIGFSSFENIVKKQRADSNFLGFCPIWNSNCGYVRAADLISTIFEASIPILIEDIWMDKIDFYQGYKTQKNENKPIVSVKVAKWQCSEWLKKKGLFYSFAERGSTTLAMQDYLPNDLDYHSILCTYKQREDSRLLSDVETSVANHFNFTTFIKTQKGLAGTKKDFALITLAISRDLGFASHQFRRFYSEICSQANTFDELPRVIFGIDLGYGTDGIIIEIKHEMLPILEEYMENIDLATDEELEEINTSYFHNLKFDAGSIRNSFIAESLATVAPYLSGEYNYFYFTPEDSEAPPNIPAFYVIPKLQMLIQGYDQKIIHNYITETIRYFSVLLSKKPSIFTAEQGEIIAEIMNGQKPVKLSHPIGTIRTNTSVQAP